MRGEPSSRAFHNRRVAYGEETKSPAVLIDSIAGPGGRLTARQARPRLTPEPEKGEDPRQMGGQVKGRLAPDGESHSLFSFRHS